ncbi:uncharacterized protein MEPE_02087 [Melanopsichium pennsylvanicum]|uniref:Uncharacterized protein n=2 Tax=Melanopsichium pennsylvanicum TaxID=63383 RepID=A0AAJ4XJL3_9BASI|nr:uncharacterized protein MEPE_02087 [Melanopsichium pennsylvanicum]
MPFADLLRRPSTRVTVHPPTSSASTSDHSSSTSKICSSPSARERLPFGRSAKSQPYVHTHTHDLLYPNRELQTPYNNSSSSTTISISTNSRGSHYSTTDDHSIGQAPFHSPSSTRPSPSPSPLPVTQSLPRASSSSATTTTTATTIAAAPAASNPQLNQYDRLFGLAASSSSTSLRAPSTPIPPLASSSFTRSIPSTLIAHEHTDLSTTHDKSLATASSNAPQLTRKATKSRSPFPPASASTGTSSSHRDTTTMGSVIFRRPSFGRRRNASSDSTASRTDKLQQVPQNSSSNTPAEFVASQPKSSFNTAAPKAAASTKSLVSATTSSSTGRFARLFGRRKSISSPTNLTYLSKPDLNVDPVPPLQDASATLNRNSPPLAVISAGWTDDAGTIKLRQIHHTQHRPVSPRAIVAAPAIQTGSSTSKPALQTENLSASDVALGTRTVDSAASNVSAFTFPARASLSNDSTNKELPAIDARPRHAKHSISRSLPLASIPISNPIPISASPDPSELPVPQRRPSKSGRTLTQSLAHRKNSKSLSMIGSIFGVSSSQASLSSPPLPQSAATLGQRYPPAETRASQPLEPSTSSHSRKPSLRSRLRFGRSSTADAGPRRPTTPEIESWKQKSNHLVDANYVGTPRRSRASIDSPFRPRPAESPVKITRSKSMNRRKPPPEFKQEEIDSSSTTPVYSKTFGTLDGEHHTGLPLGGSPASLSEPQFFALSGTSPKLASQLLASTKSSPHVSQDAQFKYDDAHGLGLVCASSTSAECEDASIPSIDIRPSTPSLDASPIAANEPNNNNPQPKLAPTASPAVNGKRLSLGMHSVADTSLSVDRPWSLISAGEADTPLLKLRKLVVNTNGSEGSRDESDADEGLFFRPLNSSTRNAAESNKDRSAAEATTQDMVNAIDTVEMMSEGGSEQLRSSSQTTTRSDTKHEITSNHSSGSSTLRATRSVAGQASISSLSAAAGALSDASQNSTIRLRNMPTPSLSQVVPAPVEDDVGPLPAKSPALSQHSSRTRQQLHRREASNGSTYSQATVQQGRRASTASRITTRSSGHWSESKFSEDALSALEAEVGQARRAEVVALGKGRVKDWVADRPILPMADAPMLSRSNTLRNKAQVGVTGDKLGEKEAQRQKTLNEHVSRKLKLFSEAQLEAKDAEIRSIHVEELPTASPAEPLGESAIESQATVEPHFARLSVFHDRNLMEGVQPVQQATAAIVAPSNQLVEEAIRLGRAPSKRVRRNLSEAKSVGEAVMVERESPRRASAATIAAARARRRSASASSKKPSTDQLNPTLVPAMLSTPLLNMQDVHGPTTSAPNEPSKPQTSANVEEGSKQQPKQRCFATSEEAAKAKQLELIEREKRRAEKELKRQAQLQQKYAQKKQSDPLLAARLALAGLQPPLEETMPEQVKCDAPMFKTNVFGTGLQVAQVAERRWPAAGGTGSLAATRAGSAMSFHTALDAPIHVEVAASPKTMYIRAQKEIGGDPKFTSNASAEVRPETSYSIASSLAVDFEFPVPPQRMKEQVSEDGTLLSRAGLQESPQQQEWREGRHYVAWSGSASASSSINPKMRPPPRDSSLRHHTESKRSTPQQLSTLFSAATDEVSLGIEERRGMTQSSTMPKLGAISPLDSVKQSVALRRSRSMGYNSRDVRERTKEPMKEDAVRNASRESSYVELQG